MTKSIWDTLLPKMNRRRALVAGIRTFWQSARGASAVAAGGAVVLTGSDLITLDSAGIGLGIAAVLLASLIAAGVAAGDVLSNGLPASYSAKSQTCV
jgi:hypothetical protein